MTVRLRCNVAVCQAMRQSKPAVGIADLRSALVEVGWYSDASTDLDLCPEHAPAYVEEVL